MSGLRLVALGGRSAVARTCVLMLCAGASTVLALAPYGFWPLAVLSLGMLFLCVQRAARVRQAALFGWCYAGGSMLASVHWLWIAMTRFGGLPAVPAALALILFCLAMAVYAAAMMAGSAWLMARVPRARGAALLLVLPAFWALGEWCRGWVLTGFPWASSGYVHTGSPLAGYAPVLGVYGVGWMHALLAACLAWAWQAERRVQKQSALLFICLLLGGSALRAVRWTQPETTPFSVALVQGNIAQDIKFDRAYFERILAYYRRVLTAQSADLVATSETALPVLIGQLPDTYLPDLQDYADRSHSTLMLGLGLYDGATRYTNSMLGLIPGAAAAPYRYDKHHLVPFGEFIPPGFAWFVEALQIPMGSFGRGAAVQAPLRIRQAWVLPNICYEDLFGEEIAAQWRALEAQGRAPGVLLNHSNLAWYGESVANDQHAQISQMRVLETGRPMLRATNAGATAVLWPHTFADLRLPYYREGVLHATVYAFRGVTPYLRWGNAAFLALCLISLSCFFGMNRIALRD